MRHNETPALLFHGSLDNGFVPNEYVCGIGRYYVTKISGLIWPLIKNLHILLDTPCLKLKQAHLPVFLLHALFSLQLIKMPVQQPHGFFFRKKPFFHIAMG